MGFIQKEMVPQIDQSIITIQHYTFELWHTVFQYGWVRVQAHRQCSFPAVHMADICLVRTYLLFLSFLGVIRIIT